MAKLEFSRVHSYPATEPGISLPIVLQSGTEKTTFFAYLDTGASNCLFERGHGELLNLQIEAGDHRVFRTALGPVSTFGHIVQMDVLGLIFESMVYFFEDKGINKNLLGRAGWLDRVRLGLVDHDCRLYIAPYD